jgi:hypothetical protein
MIADKLDKKNLLNQYDTDILSSDISNSAGISHRYSPADYYNKISNLKDLT